MPQSLVEAFYDLDMKYDIILHGDLIFPSLNHQIQYLPSSYLFIKDGKICKVSSQRGDEESSEYLDEEGKLILPGFSDLHAHASQYAFVGIGGDCELLDWLKFHAFDEESKFKELSYASQAYDLFVRDLRRSFTTRAALFTTVHPESTFLLMKKLEESKLPCYVGKVNMDRNAPDFLREKDAASSLSETEDLIVRSGAFSLERYIITPRFVPTCSDALLQGLGELSIRYHIPVQSHLDENLSEISWVRELVPSAENYSDVYARHRLFGNPERAIMAHCIWENEEEIKMLRENQVFVAHCPDSNLNVSSGIAPIRTYLDRGIHVGLGSDVSGGCSLNLFYAMREAMQVSKMRFRYLDDKAAPLNVEEVFYLATLGGGEFFGRVGSFLPDYDADVLVIDDTRLTTTLHLDLKSRLERLIYRGDERDLVLKLAKGNRITLD